MNVFKFVKTTGISLLLFFTLQQAQAQNLTETGNVTTAQALVNALGITGLNADQMLQVESLWERLGPSFQPYAEDFLAQNMTKFQWKDKLNVFITVIDDIRQTLTKNKRRSPDGKNWGDEASEEIDDDTFDVIIEIINNYNNWFIVYGKKKSADLQACTADLRNKTDDLRNKTDDLLAQGVAIEREGIKGFLDLYQLYLQDPDDDTLKKLQEYKNRMIEQGWNTDWLTKEFANIDNEIQKKLSK